MIFRELFAHIDYRIAPDSPLPQDAFEIEKVITSPETDGEKALYVVTKTPLRDGYNGMKTAYAMGCRLFLSSHDAVPGPDAVVLIAAQPERLVATLAARVYGHPERGMTLLGITGTAKRTASALMLERLLCRCGRKTASLTSEGLFVNGTRTEADKLAPDAAQLWRAFAKMAANGVEFAVIELSPYQLANGVARGVPFLAVAETEPCTYQEVPGGAPLAADSVIRGCEDFGQAALYLVPVGKTVSVTGRVLHYGTGGEVAAADARIVRDAQNRPYTQCTICLDGEKAEIHLPVIGEGGMHCAWLALTLARAAGVTMTELCAAADALCVPGHMECVSARGDRLIYIDDAYEPWDVERTLLALAPVTRGRLCVLLGSVGGRARERRAALGRTVNRYADFAYLTADHPDHEDPLHICEDMMCGMEERERCALLPDRRAAILRAVRELRAGDTLLLSGKGRETHQLIRGMREPFSERDVVEEAMRLVAY